MLISMQGNWTVTVKSKNAAFPQQFVVQGATTENGPHPGTPGTSVFVRGTQWSIAIQNDPGTGWQSSDTQIKFPFKSGGNYKFDIHSNDAGNDTDFNDLILTCSTPVNINEFIIYGNVSLYGKGCIFNPCRKFPFVIDTYYGLEKAVRNPVLRDWVKEYYPERIPPIIVDPNPPDPLSYFKPIVFDLSDEAIQPKTTLKYVRKPIDEKKSISKAAKEDNSAFAAANFDLLGTIGGKSEAVALSLSKSKIELARQIDKLFYNCFKEAGANLTLTFEEYDRTAGELGGGGYTGTGNRRLLGDAITDMNGNYIFRFRFDMTVPGLEDSSDISAGENVDTIIYPDVIVKIVEYSPYRVVYESAPHNNIPNLKRINLCLPDSAIHTTSACFNGNLIGSLGNVFIGGNQNTSGSTSAAATQRYGNSNFLDSNGKISVNSPLALFNVECAAWGGTIDMFGCMYDKAKSVANNKIKWYTLRIRRAGTFAWNYVSENYKHPKHYKSADPITYPNYIGDDVGPFYPNIGGTLDGTIPSYKNIQREATVDGIDWRNDKLDRFIQLNTALYDVITGVRTPGKFYVRVDGYDSAGNHVAGATDLVALFIHNNGLQFKMTTPIINDPAVLKADCNLFRLTDDQLKTPIVFSFEARDPEGFVDNYALTMGRCPGTALNLISNIEANFTITGNHTFPGGSNPLNVHHNPHDSTACPGYKGTEDDYSIPGLVNIQIEPPAIGDGWIKPGEYFTVYSFGLTANQRVTNGYNGAISGTYQAYGQIMMELLNP